MNHIGEYKTETESFISTLNEQISQLHTTINNKIQKNIMELVGEDLYDYSDIETYELEDIINQKSLESNFSGYHIFREKINMNINNIIKKKGEKVIIHFLESYGNQSGCYWCPVSESYTIITNYGTIYYICKEFKQQNNYGTQIYKEFIKRYDYWLPKDYINILKYMTYTMQHSTQLCNLNQIPKGNCNIETLQPYCPTYILLNTILEHIKENLYNGRYVKNNVDIHYMDVYNEKEKLTEEQETFEMYKNAKEIELEIKMNKLEEDMKNFEIKKTQLKRISQKLKIEQKNIDKQKEDLEKLLLNNTTTDELFDALELDNISVNSDECENKII
jgi:hypothetical protein